MSSSVYPSLGQASGREFSPLSGLGTAKLAVAIALEPVVDSEEAAKFLNINPKTLQKMARNGVVPGYRIGKLWKFRISDLDAWLRSKVISNGHSCRENGRR